MAFVHRTGATGKRWLPEITGAGAALFDADGDDDLDLFLTNGQGPHQLYLQRSPGSFEPAPLPAPPAGTHGMGVTAGDYDADGDLDLYVTSHGRDQLLANAGDGTFTDVTESAGLGDDGWGTSAVFFDLDRDGDLDLFVARYAAFDPDVQCHDKAGMVDYCGPLSLPPTSDLLYRNRGDGTFEDVSRRASVSTKAAAGLGVVAEDFDGDGWTDLAVANDAYANHLWLNQKDGTLRESGIAWGFAFNQHGQAEAGMGIVCADLDGDLGLDLFLTHLDVESNTIYRASGKGWFEDVSGRTGLAAPSMPYTGFGVVALDVEHDGDLDLFVANGRVVRGRDARADDPWSAYVERNLAFENVDGRFEERANAFTAPAEISRGLASGDLDGDGDLDLVVCNIEAPVRLYRNVAADGSHWLSVRAVAANGSKGAPIDSIGARVTLRSAGGDQVRGIHAQGSYLSSSPFRAHFGLGDQGRYDAIDVRWPDGTEERFPGGSADRRITLVQGEGELR